MQSPAETTEARPALDVLRDMKDSGGEARDMTPPQISALKTLFADPDVGLWWFNREIMQFKDMVWDFHGPLCQLVGHWGESHLANNEVIHHTPKGGYEEDNVVHSYRRIMVRIPRETFKSSILTRGAALRCVTLDPERTIGIFNETQEKPLQWIDTIRQVVEGSQLYQVLYSDILPRGVTFMDKEKGVSTSRKLKWGGTGMRFERQSYGVSENSLEPHGITGTAVGKHFTHMIWDDIIGLKAAESPAVMEAAKTWVDNSRPLERPAEGGCVLVPHTRWAYNDVYKHMEEKWPGEWQIFHRALLENEETGEPDDVFGVSTFPTKISTKKAHQMRKTDSFVFSAQYQNQPKAGKSQSFQEEHNGHFHIEYEGSEPVIYIDKTGSRSGFDGTVFELDMDNPPPMAPQQVPLSYCLKGILIDPAPSKGSEIRQNRNANNALVVYAIDPWGRKFNLEACISKDGPTEVLEKVVALARTWQAWDWSVEEVVFSANYQPLWSTIMSLREDMADCRPQWLPVSPEGRDKESRIRINLIAPHESGLMYYNMGHPDDKSPGCPSGYLLKELKEFPHGDVVDCVDAWAYISDDQFIKPQTPESMETAWWKKRKEKGSVAGYGSEITYMS